jgi:opacity protein-like surface antigen
VTRLLLLVAALLAVMPVPADAQARPSTPLGTSRPRQPRIEVGVGGGMLGGLSLGERDASLKSNSTTAAPFRLFATDTNLDPAAGLEVRLGYRTTPRLTVEGTLGFARPTLTSSLSADAEGAASVDATTTLTEYLITGGALWKLSVNPRRRWTPFVSGGAGVARHVHDGQTLIESGVDGYAGGGILYSLNPRVGLRFDGRAHILNGGVAEGQGVSPRGSLSGSIFVAF